MNATSLACAVAFTSFGASAGATTVSQYISGKISGPHTVDSGGLFSPAGTDLSGTPYQLHFQYETDRFTTSCGSTASDCGALSKGSTRGTVSLVNPSNPASVLISVEINGIDRAFAPFVLGNVAFRQNGAQGGIQVLIDMTNGNYTSSAAVYLSYTSPTVFGAELSPSNNPIASDGAELQLCVAPLGGGTTPACDTLSLGIMKALK